jgi:hypothetical protein
MEEDMATALDKSTGSAGLEEDAVEALNRRLGTLEPEQIAAWRRMSPARRLELAFQAYPTSSPSTSFA